MRAHNQKKLSGLLQDFLVRKLSIKFIAHERSIEYFVEVQSHLAEEKGNDFLKPDRGQPHTQSFPNLFYLI